MTNPNQVYGRRQEFVAIAELLKRGYQVFQTLVDDEGIDCVVRRVVDGKPVYIDLQIKARSTKTKPKNAGYFPTLRIPAPRPNYFFMFHSAHVESYWLIPSEDLTNGKASRHKTGKSAGAFALRLTNPTKHGPKPRPKYEAYREERGFALLDEAIRKLALG